MSTSDKPLVVIRESKISGKGLFADRDIPEGSVVLRWHPKVISKEVAKKLPDDEKQYLYLEGDSVIWMQSPERYMNHSCEPNTESAGQTDVALRDIQEGEEITTDYGDDESDRFNCSCGAQSCRGVIGTKKD